MARHSLSPLRAARSALVQVDAYEEVVRQRDERPTVDEHATLQAERNALNARPTQEELSHVKAERDGRYTITS